MDLVWFTVFGVLAAAVMGVALGERLEAVREGDSELPGALGTAMLWVVAGAVILPNLRQGGAKGLSLCLIVLLVLPELLSKLFADRECGGTLHRGGNLCAAAVLVLHHFPEGMAAGVVCGAQGVGAAALCWAVVLHSIPETMMLLHSLTEAGFGRWNGRVGAAVSALVTAAGVLLGASI